MQASDYKLLVYPALWIIASQLVPSTAFLESFLLSTLGRYVVNHSFTFLAHVESVSQRLRIIDKNPPAEQLQRELDWDNPLIGSVIAAFIVQLTPWVNNVKQFSLFGVAFGFLAHYLITEPLYYFFHRVLHWRRFYKHSHKHHHTSVITESMSGTSHPFWETVVYLVIFSFPILVPLWYGYLSYEFIVLYPVWFDVMNCIGHCNFEVVPLWLQYGPLKYFMYSSTYHSFHHTRFVRNYCLFCPVWDYIFGTVCLDAYKMQREIRLNKQPKLISAVFIVHGLEWNSVFHMPMISPYLSTQRCEKALWMYPFLPFCIIGPLVARLFVQSCFTVQRWCYQGTHFATWSTPCLAYSYLCCREYPSINKILLRSVRQAAEQGATHVGLGALNKAVFLNNGGKDLVAALGDDCIVKVVTGNTMTAAIVYHRIRLQASLDDEIFFTGATSAIGTAVVLRLLQDGYKVRVMTKSDQRFEKLQLSAGILSKGLARATCEQDGVLNRVWVLGSALNKPVGKLMHGDAMFFEFAVPPTRPEFIRPFEVNTIGNVSYDSDLCDLTVSCDCKAGEMPACLAGTIVHALEGFSEHEVGEIAPEKLDVWFDLAVKHKMIKDSGREVSV
eukprot:TRINITY_DN1998_c0_g1_i1.p1 TRINITY_DN1998_c0_g1~~TRINITY_DN1998_c0_g1_i1.p1  ORF type:complete len:633 (-),score=77.53 TRINITY_DN1998_c0_g1_i1:373-2211(-)